MKNEVAGSNRRGFLGIFGMGVAAGPQMVQEALTKDSLPNVKWGQGNALAQYVAGEGKNLADSSMDDWVGEDEEEDYEKKGVDGTNYSHKYIRDLRYKLDDEAEVEYLKKYGPTVAMRREAGAFANHQIHKNIFPSHIEALKSFSITRKRQMAYEHYFIRHLEQQVEQKIYDLQRKSEDRSMEKYKKLYKKTKAAFLGKALKRIF